MLARKSNKTSWRHWKIDNFLDPPLVTKRQRTFPKEADSKKAVKGSLPKKSEPKELHVFKTKKTQLLDPDFICEVREGVPGGRYQGQVLGSRSVISPTPVLQPKTWISCCRRITQWHTWNPEHPEPDLLNKHDGWTFGSQLSFFRMRKKWVSWKKFATHDISTFRKDKKDPTDICL